MTSIQLELRERYKDIALSALFLVIGALAFLAVNPGGQVVDPGYGGVSFRTVPFICGTALIALTAVYTTGVVRQILVLRRAASDSVAVQSGDSRTPLLENHTLWRRLAVLLVLTVYATAIEPVGFGPATAVFLFLMFYLFGQTKHLQNMIVAAIGGTGFYLLFIVVLKLPL